MSPSVLREAFKDRVDVVFHEAAMVEKNVDEAATLPFRDLLRKKLTLRGAYPVPGENLYNLLNFLVLPMIVRWTRAGRFLGVDAYARPRLLASKSGVLRWLGKIGT